MAERKKQLGILTHLQSDSILSPKLLPEIHTPR